MLELLIDIYIETSLYLVVLTITSVRTAIISRLVIYIETSKYLYLVVQTGTKCKYQLAVLTLVIVCKSRYRLI